MGFEPRRSFPRPPSPNPVPDPDCLRVAGNQSDTHPAPRGGDMLVKTTSPSRFRAVRGLFPVRADCSHAVRCDFLPALIVTLFPMRAPRGLAAHRLDRFERRYSFARHGLQPLAQRVSVIRYELGPVPRAADFNVQRLLRRQMGVVCFHCRDHRVHCPPLERVHRGCPGAVDVA